MYKQDTSAAGRPFRLEMPQTYSTPFWSASTSTSFGSRLFFLQNPNKAFEGLPEPSYATYTAADPDLTM